MGGGASSTQQSSIEKILFPFDSGTASIVGNLNNIVTQGCGVNSTLYGYSIGGYSTSSYITTIDRILFPFNSGTASSVGNLSYSKSGPVGIDGVDFVSQFANWATNI